MRDNPLKMKGISFVEFSAPQPEKLHQLFLELGFSKISRHREKAIDLYLQGEIIFLLNSEENSFAASFHKLHGPCICSMGWNVNDSEEAFAEATSRGARSSNQGDYQRRTGDFVPALSGIGDSLIYLIESADSDIAPLAELGFEKLQDPLLVPQKGFSKIDHLTNNVHKGTMEEWAKFYKEIFGFREVRHFDIKGKKTGLTSYALMSPCGQFSIPINEAEEEKSQINEYLDEYKGPGVQHLAFLTENLLASINDLKGTSIETLDIDPDYYQSVFKRVKGVKEDPKAIERANILVDGDEDGYLLQIFSKNLIGPIFIEFIQRENHNSFGEGNFQALFDSIERDQERRGVL